MRNVLLTSTGFDNDNIKNKFLSLLNKNISEVKVLFVITAAQDPGAVRILSGCLDDLTKCNISDDNITIYDMHKKLDINEINIYDAIYVCGGCTKYLVQRMDEINFKEQVNEYLNNGGIYIGVSAGTIAFSNKYPNEFNLINNIVDVHCNNGNKNGIIDYTNDINLTDNQAIFIDDDKSIIFE